MSNELDKMQNLEEAITKVGKYLEFYSFQANRDALLGILTEFYDRAFELGEKSEKRKNVQQNQIDTATVLSISNTSNTKE